MKQVAPGIYEDGEELHVDLPELLRLSGVPVTPENMERASQQLAELMKGKGIPVIDTYDPW